MMNIPRSALFGAAFGLIAPFVGLFVGLQVSPLLGSILTFPMGVMFWLTGVPLGEMSAVTLILTWIISILLWAAIFYGLAKLVENFKK